MTLPWAKFGETDEKLSALSSQLPIITNYFNHKGSLCRPNWHASISGDICGCVSSNFTAVYFTLKTSVNEPRSPSRSATCMQCTCMHLHASVIQLYSSGKKPTKYWLIEFLFEQYPIPVSLDTYIGFLVCVISHDYHSIVIIQPGHWPGCNVDATVRTTKRLRWQCMQN